MSADGRTAAFINAAFAEILRLDFETARRYLAEAQTSAFGQKPWKPGVPTKDVLDRSIVFKDLYGRYSIPVLVDATQAHIRVDLGTSEPFQNQPFAAYGRTADEARGIASIYAEERKEKHWKNTSSLTVDGWIVLRYEFTRPALD